MTMWRLTRRKTIGVGVVMLLSLLFMGMLPFTQSSATASKDDKAATVGQSSNQGSQNPNPNEYDSESGKFSNNFPVAARNTRYCVSVSDFSPTTDRYQCTDNPLETMKEARDRHRNQYQNPQSDQGGGYDDGLPPIKESFGTGLPQRIDGTEAEQRAIREILDQMDDYFVREVYSMPEYESVRATW